MCPWDAAISSSPKPRHAFGIASKTAGAHVEHILAKLGVSRRAEIAAWATTVDRSMVAR